VGTVLVLLQISVMPQAEFAARGARARAALTAELSQARLLAAFCDILERGVAA